jgi:hypothetical protein
MKWNLKIQLGAHIRKENQILSVLKELLKKKLQTEIFCSAGQFQMQN